MQRAADAVVGGALGALAREARGELTCAAGTAAEDVEDQHQHGREQQEAAGSIRLSTPVYPRIIETISSGRQDVEEGEAAVDEVAHEAAHRPLSRAMVVALVARLHRRADLLARLAARFALRAGELLAGPRGLGPARAAASASLRVGVGRPLPPGLTSAGCGDSVSDLLRRNNGGLLIESTGGVTAPPPYRRPPGRVPSRVARPWGSVIG